MRQLKAYKFRMYPNEEQKIFFTTEISTQVKIYWRKI
ncbi:helix-turn-helix domain-containing protein [Fusobacterium necrophorum]|nr:helix-turn-helix domain-containing protein [Fusobacterium necrophorum]